MRSIALRFGILAVLLMGATGCAGNANDLAVGECFDPPEDRGHGHRRRLGSEAHGAEVVSG